jgi:hypothetical protein
LDAAGQLFSDLIHAQPEPQPSQPLEAALDDLSALVLRLCDHSSRPALALHARRQLAHIHHQLALAPTASTAPSLSQLDTGGDLFGDITD